MMKINRLGTRHYLKTGLTLIAKYIPVRKAALGGSFAIRQGIESNFSEQDKYLRPKYDQRESLKVFHREQGNCWITSNAVWKLPN